MNNNSSTILHPDSYGFYYDYDTGHFFPIFNPPLTENLIVSITGFLFCTISLILYLYVCYVIFKNKTGTFSNVFYTLVLHLALPDCVYLFMQIIIGFPVPFFGFKNVSHDFVAACGFVVTVTNWVIPILVLVMGVNRYVAICKFDYYHILFTKLKVHIVCACCWICMCAYATIFYVCTCYNYKAGYSWKFSCATDTCVTGVTYSGLAIGIVETVSVPVLYCSIFFHYKYQKFNRSLALRQNHNQQSPTIDKRDMNMLLQFSVISGVLLLNFAVFWAYGRISIRYGDILVQAAGCLNSAINPYLYFFCSTEIRKSIRDSGTLISTITVKPVNNSRTLQY